MVFSLSVDNIRGQHFVGPLEVVFSEPYCKLLHKIMKQVLYAFLVREHLGLKLLHELFVKNVI